MTQTTQTLNEITAAEVVDVELDQSEATKQTEAAEVAQPETSDPSVEVASGVEVTVDEPTVQVSEVEAPLPVSISENVKLAEGEIDPNDTVEVVKAIFIQFGTDYGSIMHTQLDCVDGTYTLTSFGNPTLQFAYCSDVAKQRPEATAEEIEYIQNAVFVSGFPADDAVGVLEMALNMQERLSRKGLKLDIAGMIAPVRTESGRHVLVADPDQVMAIAAKAAYLSGRATLKRIEDAQNAVMAAEQAEAAEKAKADEVPAATVVVDQAVEELQAQSEETKTEQPAEVAQPTE
ncbi:hypothetical protein SHAb15599_00187 [Acinetobacter phage SH-Ab 15599]|nr:hypothetical protein SHAb15599_00187 [Acinetobacter phage SH-Ab 15599]